MLCDGETRLWWRAAYPRPNIHCTHPTVVLFPYYEAVERALCSRPGFFSHCGSKVVCFTRSGGRAWCEVAQPRPKEASHRGVMCASNYGNRLAQIRGAAGPARLDHFGRASFQPPRGAGKCRRGTAAGGGNGFVGSLRDPPVIKPSPDLARCHQIVGSGPATGNLEPGNLSHVLYICMPGRPAWYTKPRHRLSPAAIDDSLPSACGTLTVILLKVL